MTNRDAIRLGLTPCELRFKSGRGAKLDDSFHAIADVTCGEIWPARIRVCQGCYRRWFAGKKSHDRPVFAPRRRKVAA